MATRMNLRWTMECGLPLQVINYSDWLTYNEVFVNREYGSVVQPVRTACSGTGKNVVLDLGANAGYFSAFLAEQLFTLGFRAELKFIMIEASPILIRELNFRMPKTCGVFEFAIVEGLAGKKQGSAHFEIDYKENSNHVAGFGIPSANKTVSAVECAYIDLESLVKPSDRISCIKIDIEGSEFDLIEEYPALLARAQTLVIEFHHQSGNVSDAIGKVRAIGFDEGKVCKKSDLTTTYLFLRKN